MFKHFESIKKLGIPKFDYKNMSEEDKREMYDAVVIRNPEFMIFGFDKDSLLAFRKLWLTHNLSHEPPTSENIDKLNLYLQGDDYKYAKDTEMSKEYKPPEQKDMLFWMARMAAIEMAQGNSKMAKDVADLRNLMSDKCWVENE